jgi:cytochrome c oxidase cbb3-type subunit 3
MSDFVSGFWSVYVAVLTLAGIVACAVLLKAMSTKRRAAGEKPKLHGHVWDGDLAEYDNPLPRWWAWLFVLTIVFSLAYLAVYPGLGNYAGALGWSSVAEYETETAQAEARYGPTFNRYLEQGLATVAEDPEALAIGQRLYLNYCAQCHGSDARGGIGFPNLRDKDWLYGGDPESIKATILNGRSGVMPPMEAAVGGIDGAKYVMHYLFSLSGRTHSSLNAALGKERFAACAACHGIDGKGNKTLGAPNIADDIWLHGGSEEAIVSTITMGRKSQMPAHKDLLGEAKAHVLAAYVYSLSLDPGEVAAKKAYGREPGAIKPAETGK